MKFISALLLVAAPIIFAELVSAAEEGINQIELKKLQNAAQDGLDQVGRMIELEKRLLSDGLVSNKRRKSSRMNIIPGESNQSSRQETLHALGVIEASKKLKEQLNLEDGTSPDLSDFSLRNTALETGCPEPLACIESRYRSIDGSCNNMAHPNRGQQNTIFQRLLPAQYGNGIDSPRLATTGDQLENPRKISVTTVRIYGIDEKADVTLSVMSFGQFITHDMALSEDFTFENGSSPACCTRLGQIPTAGNLHPQCLPIAIDVSDIMFSESGRRCMSFTRSKVGTDLSCTFGQAEQLNSNTHYLDGSQIYGSDMTTSNALRSRVNGQLKTTDVNGRQLFPIVAGCENQINHELAVCFQAGDGRVEENPQLTAIHLVFLREHNRVANELRRLNPHWDDEILFQETRRIVVAQLQHITYNEYLPALLGSQVMKDKGLLLPSSGFGNGYDISIDPSVMNDFTAAAFRVTHSSIQGYLYLLNSADEEDTSRSFSLSNYFFDASRFMDDPEFFDSSLRGLTKQPPQAIDALYSSEVTSNLYKGKHSVGGDLVAITLQRGREHGIPSYNEFRQFCGLRKAQSFEDLVTEMYIDDINLLKTVYNSVDDIDLYLGCLYEIHVQGSLMGPTALCVTANQFQRTKNGDRFFYDVGGLPSSFTLDQLDQIRRSSLARLFCDNNDGTVVNMQPSAMRSPIGANQRIPCASIPSMDLSPWQEL